MERNRGSDLLDRLHGLGEESSLQLASHGILAIWHHCYLVPDPHLDARVPM
jgi:hypothetical protein